MKINWISMEKQIGFLYKPFSTNYKLGPFFLIQKELSLFFIKQIPEKIFSDQKSDKTIF